MPSPAVACTCGLLLPWPCTCGAFSCRGRAPSPAAFSFCQVFACQQNRYHPVVKGLYSPHMVRKSTNHSIWRETTNERGHTSILCKSARLSAHERGGSGQH